MKWEIGDIVEYKRKIHIVTDAQYDLKGNENLYTAMYRLDGISRWILDCFLEQVK